MGELKIKFDDEIERKFRELAMRKYGFYKGALKKAGEEAITEWVNSENRELPSIKNSIKFIRGIMEHLKAEYKSVELQHETAKLWAKTK